MSEHSLFLYGTLRSVFGHEVFKLVRCHSVPLGDAIVPGRLFDLGRYPGMVLTRDGSVVVGELYEVATDEWNEVISRLDAHEGCRRDDPRPHEYRRELVHARLQSGAVVMAWAYVLRIPTDGRPEISCGDYVLWRRARSA